MLILNDLKSQFDRKMQKMSREDINDTIYDMEHCHHLFVKLKEGEEFLAPHSSDCEKDPPIVECVHCGITNKFMDLEELYCKKVLKLIKVSNGIGYPTRSIILSPQFKNETLESKEFRKQFSIYGSKRFNDSYFNYISKEELITYHPGLLFHLAMNFMLSVDIDHLTQYDKKEIFNIMKELNKLETDYEKDHLMYPMDCDDLLDRYRKIK